MVIFLFKSSDEDLIFVGHLMSIQNDLQKKKILCILCKKNAHFFSKYTHKKTTGKSFFFVVLIFLLQNAINTFYNLYILGILRPNH